MLNSIKLILIKLIHEKSESIENLFESLYEFSNYKKPQEWNLFQDQIKTQNENALQVAQCTKIFKNKKDQVNCIVYVKHSGKFVVNIGEKLSPTDIEEGMRVGIDRSKYQIQITLPLKIDPNVTMMTVEEKPEITYKDIGGCKNQILEIKEIVEYPLLYPRRFSLMGIDPPKGALLYGPPGTGKTLVARAVANKTNASFVKINCSELVQKYIGEGARLVRELFNLSKTKFACIMFFDELDAIGGTRFSGASGGENEVQRTMLEIVNQLDGFEKRGNTKVLMATNRPDTIDPALLRPGRLDRKIEFSLPDLSGRVTILKIHSKKMKKEESIRYELIARLCPNSTGADIRSICIEAGMFAIRKRHKVVFEEDFLDSINKVLKNNIKFSYTSRYVKYN